MDLIVIDDYYQGNQCSNCRGLLFNRSLFRDVVGTRRSRTKGPPEPFNTFDPKELDRKTFCPICEKKMETFQYLGPGNIVIDTCHQDDLIWLDFGELSKVVNAPGRDRGIPRKKPTEDEDKKKEDKRKNLADLTLFDLINAFFNRAN
jgi:Zn-finger nucleic acid-binding protein